MMKLNKRQFILGSTLAFKATLMLVLSTISVMAFAQDTDAPEPEVTEVKEAQAPPQEPDPVAVNPPKGKVPLNLLQLGKGESFSRYALVADKATRTLSVWENDNGIPKFVEAHPMDIGKKQGNKTVENDNRTPEGVYFPQRILEGNSLDYENYGVRAFPLDYPNFFDKREKKTGYGIWLHAIPPTKTLNRGSRGCVVVRNEIIEKLGKFIELKKTPFIIDDEVEYADTKLFSNKKNELLAWLQGWESSWENKEIDSYIEHYGEDFRSLRMDKPTWKRFKEGLNKKYESIGVSIYNPTVLSKDDMFIITFLQEYDSDMKKDFGVKTLFVKSRESGFKIVGEVWKPATSELLALKEKLEVRKQN